MKKIKEIIKDKSKNKEKENTIINIAKIKIIKTLNVIIIVKNVQIQLKKFKRFRQIFYRLYNNLKNQYKN
jgi:hypothetical protein